MNHLPLQIGQRNAIVIGNPKRAHTGGSKILQHRRPKTAGADDKHARRFQFLLTGAADLRQKDMTVIAGDFV